MKLQEKKAINPLDDLEALSTRIKSLISVCPFDLESFYSENKGLVKKYLRKNTLDLEIPDFQDVPEDWMYKNQDGILRHGIKDRPYTTLQMLDWIKCGLDVAYLAKKHVKIISIDEGMINFSLYDFQVDLLHLYQNNRFVISMQARQTGKCVTGSTRVEINFLGEYLRTSIASTFKMATTINRLKLSYKEFKDVNEQIHEALLQIDNEEESSYSRVWGEASYNSKKYWWDKLKLESSNADSKGTLYSSYAFSGNVQDQIKRTDKDAPCLQYDVPYENGCIYSRENLREKDERTFWTYVGVNERTIKSILWKDSWRKSPKGYVRKETIGGLKSEKIRNDENMVGGKQGRICSASTRDWSLRESKTEQIRKETFTRTQRQDRFFNERVLFKPYSSSKRSSFDGGNKTEVIRSWKGTQKNRRTQKEDWRWEPRKNSTRRIKKENVRSEAIKTNSKMSSLSYSRQRGGSNDEIPLQQLQKKKFRESYITSGLMKVWSDSGWIDISEIHQTIKYRIWNLKTKNFSLDCADNHIVFDENYNEIFVKDLREHMKIWTENGLETVEYVGQTEESEYMYDLGVSHKNHRYFTDGILSHNTTVTSVYILWFIMFQEAKTSAILANKADQAQEILSRVQLSYESLPMYLQPGVRVYNKRKMELEHHSVAFSAASSSGSIRGKSIALLYIDECAFIPNDMEFYESTYPTVASGKNSQVIVTSTPNGTRGLFYKLWEESKAGKNEFVNKLVTWDLVPGRDNEWKKQTIANTSLEQFAQEHECVTGDTVVSVKDDYGVYNMAIEDLNEILSNLKLTDETNIKENSIGRKGVVYKLTRTDMKEYIGTALNFKQRLSQHLNSERFSGENKIFDWEFLYEGDYYDCLLLESYFIQKYNTFFDGLNETIDGKGNHLSPNFTTLGYKYTEEQKQKISDSHKKRDKSTYWPNIDTHERAKKAMKTKSERAKKTPGIYSPKITIDERKEIIKGYNKYKLNLNDCLKFNLIKVTQKRRLLESGWDGKEKLINSGGSEITKFHVYSYLMAEKYNVTIQCIRGILKRELKLYD